MFILFGKKLDDTKIVRFGLTEVYGIGIPLATKICNELDIPETVKISELTEIQKTVISIYIKNHLYVESKLQQKIVERIDNLKTIGCLKGFRHRSKLPVRGQRTHSNAKTCKRVSF